METPNALPSQGNDVVDMPTLGTGSVDRRDLGFIAGDGRLMFSSTSLGVMSTPGRGVSYAPV